MSIVIDKTPFCEPCEIIVFAIMVLFIYELRNNRSIGIQIAF